MRPPCGLFPASRIADARQDACMRAGCDNCFTLGENVIFTILKYEK